MLMQRGTSWSEYLSSFGDMAYLLALLALVPVLSTPVKLGGYSDAIQTVLHYRIRGVFQLNCLVTALAFVCGSFMGLAAVPILMTALRPIAMRYPIRDRERFIVVATVYGYSLPVLWTPMSGVLGVILYTLKVDWLELFPVLFTVSALSLLANWLIFYFLELRGSPVPTADSGDANGDRADDRSSLLRLIEMALAIVLLILTTVILERWVPIGLITIVTLVAIPYALLWSTAIGAGRSFLAETRSQMSISLPRMADQFAIFLSAGFFTRAMQLSGFGETLNLMFVQLHDALGAAVFLLLMPPMALAASFLGIHPLVLMALLGESLRPEILGISPVRLCVAMLGSAVLTYMAGPFSGTLALVQSINQVSSFRLSLWNAPYALGYFLILATAIVFL